MKAESSSVENNNDNPLLFDERIVKKSDHLNSHVMNFNFDSQIKDNKQYVYNLKDLNSSVNASVTSDQKRKKRDEEKTISLVQK